MVTWKWVLGALFAVLLMRVGGLITNFWTWVGVVGFLLILALTQTLPAFRRFAAAVFIVGVLVFFAVPALWTALKLDRPILGPALARRSIDSELQSAEWLDPVALRARIGLARYCLEVDQLQGEWLDQRLRELRATIEPPRPGMFRRLGITLGVFQPPRVDLYRLPQPEPNVEQVLYTWLRFIEQHRSECRKLVLQVGAKPSAPSEGGEGWLEQAYAGFTGNPRISAFAAMLVLLAVTALLIIVRLLQGKPFGRLAVAAAVLLVAWLIADRQFAQGTMPALLFLSAAQSSPAGEIERREIPLEPPGTWVPIASLPPWRVKVDQRHVRGVLEIRYNDGREIKAGPDDKLTLSRTLYPVALKGEGIGLIWLCPPPSKACE